MSSEPHIAAASEVPSEGSLDGISTSMIGYRERQYICPCLLHDGLWVPGNRGIWSLSLMYVNLFAYFCIVQGILQILACFLHGI